MKDAPGVDRFSPVAFLCYATEDRDLAKEIATQLMHNGIDTWWDQWEIRAGDSVVQKISDGLGNCTHFIALLSKRSIDRPWVKAEMDAAFIRKLTYRVKFIPLRCDLPAERLPTLLRALHSPQITDSSLPQTVAQLANDIFGVTKKPAIGNVPTVLGHPAAPYSPAAMAVAEYFCRETRHAGWGDPQVTKAVLSEAVGLSLDDTVDAVHELRHFVQIARGIGIREEDEHVWPEPDFWPEFDRYFDYNPDPIGDGATIAVHMMNDLEFPEDLSSIATELDWSPRRLNPAVAYLIMRELVRHVAFLGRGHWVTSKIQRTHATRRFVKGQI